MTKGEKSDIQKLQESINLLTFIAYGYDKECSGERDLNSDYEHILDNLQEVLDSLRKKEQEQC